MCDFTFVKKYLILLFKIIQKSVIFVECISDKPQLEKTEVL